MKKIWVIIAVILSCCFFIFSCKKNHTTNPSSGITTDSNTYSQLQIAILTANNISFRQTQYTGTISGQTVKICVYNDKLGFIVPEVAAGNYQLKTSIEGVNYSININIASLPLISNPDSVISSSRLNCEYSATYLQNLITLTSTMPDSINDGANITILENYSTQLTSSLNNASSDDKMLFAKFIVANSTIFKPLRDVINTIDSFDVYKTTVSADVVKQIKDIEQEFRYRIDVDVLHIIIALGVCTAANASATLTAGASLLITAFSFGSVAYEVFSDEKWLIIEMRKAFVLTGSFSIDGYNRTTAGQQEFHSNQAYTFDISGQYRNLYKQDKSSSAPLISAWVVDIDKFQTSWNTIMSYLPTVLTGNSFSLDDVSTYKTKNMAIDPAYLMVNNISNPNVSTSYDNSADNLNITFTTNQTSDQSFTYDIVYNCGQTDVIEQPFSATLTQSVTNTFNDVIQNGYSVTNFGDSGSITWNYLSLSMTIQLNTDRQSIASSSISSSENEVYSGGSYVYNEIFHTVSSTINGNNINISYKGGISNPPFPTSDSVSATFSGIISGNTITGTLNTNYNSLSISLAHGYEFSITLR